MYESTDWDTFTMTNPHITVPVIEELRRRGHEVVLNHVARPPANRKGIDTRYYKDTGRLKDLWLDEGYEIRDQLRLCFQKFKGEDDVSYKALTEIRKWMGSSDWKPVDADLQVVILYPCVSAFARYEVAHAVVRGVVSGIPTIMVDPDAGTPAVLGSIDDLYLLGEHSSGNFKKWDGKEFRKKFYLFGGMLRRVWNGNQGVAPPSYLPEMELPLDRDAEPEYVFGYVGNDYHRTEILGNFYKSKLETGEEVRNAVWGRWKPEKRPPSVNDECFLGPVPPGEISNCYRKCASSVVIAHERYYALRLLTLRWVEILEAGRLPLVDAGLFSDFDVLKQFTYVGAAEDAYHALNGFIDGQRYWSEIEKLREAFRSSYVFSVKGYADSIEIAGQERPQDLIQPSIPIGNIGKSAARRCIG
jgi:hypothetical protein